MKKLLPLIIILFITAMSFAQTQQGFVKTKGRRDVKGKHIHGQGLKGATVFVHGRTAILVNKNDGAFSFPVTGAQFQLDSVRKIGYQLVDIDACPRAYKLSSNPIYLVMETPEQQLQDKLDAERKIRSMLQKQLQERENEIEILKAQQKITDEEYRQALQKIYQEQETNEKLISEMAKRYAELDYDQLDEFYHQVSYYIENGELMKADSLLGTRGDIHKQVTNILQQGKALQKEKEQLQKAEAVHEADIEEAAQRCYSYFETYVAQQMYDTATYFLELRASLDTTNLQWTAETGALLLAYTSQYNKALTYLNKALNNSSEESEFSAIIHNNLGSFFSTTADFEKAKHHYSRALEIRKNIYGEDHYLVGQTINNIGDLYLKLGKNEEAMECFEEGLAIRLKCFGELHPDVAESYNNIGYAYLQLGSLDESLSYLLKAYSIYDQLNIEDPKVAICIQNLGNVYHYKRDFETSLSYMERSIIMFEQFLAPPHYELARVYFNTASVYYDNNDYLNSIVFIDKAVSMFEVILDRNHPDLYTSYDLQWDAYEKAADKLCFQNDYNKAIEYYEKALYIYEHHINQFESIKKRIREKIEFAKFANDLK